MKNLKVSFYTLVLSFLMLPALSYASCPNIYEKSSAQDIMKNMSICGSKFNTNSKRTDTLINLPRNQAWKPEYLRIKKEAEDVFNYLGSSSSPNTPPPPVETLRALYLKLQKAFVDLVAINKKVG